MDTASDLLLTICTAQHTYIARRRQVNELRLITSSADLERPDERGREVLYFDLAALLDPDDTRRFTRCHALLVHMRRRSVGFLLERIDDVNTHTATTEGIQPLPSLLAQSLDHPWFLGVVVREETPLLVLDMRRIAQDILLSQKQQC